MARVRKEQGWKPPLPVQHDEIVDDMLPLFPNVDDSSAALPLTEQFVMTLVASAELADEPELEGIIIEPFLCMNEFVRAGVAMGHDPSTFLELPEEEREAVQFDMLAETIRRLLTDELRQDILDGLDKLRLRLRQSDSVKGVARVAVLQSFLSSEAESDIWASVGLVHAIFHRSISAGFELAEVSAEAFEAEGSGRDPMSLAEKLGRSSVVGKTESLLKRVPGLGEYLSKQADTTWDEGRRAVFDGELYLGLFGEEELIVGQDLFRQSLGSALEEATSRGLDERETPAADFQDFVSRVGDYIAGLFTPERLDELRARLDAVLRERAIEKRWLPFVFMLRGYIAEPDAAENERHFLTGAFLGEVLYASSEILETND